MSHFSFLQAEWPAVHEAAAGAEASAFPGSRTSGCRVCRSAPAQLDASFGSLQHRATRGQP